MKIAYDSRLKKPKVYHIGAIFALLALGVFLAFRFGGPGVLIWSPLGISLCFFLVTFLFLQAMRRQMEYNLYSYNTIIYFGFALFTLALACSFLDLLFQLLQMENPGEVRVEILRDNILSRFASSATTYMLLTLPFLFVFSVALMISNLSLIRHEGFRPVNLLGILLAVLLLLGEGLVFALNYYVSGSETEVMLHDLFINLLAAIYLYLECMLLGTVVADAIAARLEPKKNKDFIIVLGCAIRKDGSPTPLLRGRLDRALEFARRQEKETGKAPIFVLSGGRGPDECISEAESMRRYLDGLGVPPERMILEDKSTDTAENMRFSKEKILERDPKAVVAFSTTNYHVFRSGLKARRVKMKAMGMGCRSKWYFWPNAAVREFIGLLTQHRGKQLLILLGLLAAFAAVTLLSYHVLG